MVITTLTILPSSHSGATDLWENQLSSRKHRTKRGGGASTPSSVTRERRKKPVVVSGPYVIYMLDDMDILEDWTAIKKALKQKQQVHRRPKSSSTGARVHHSSSGEAPVLCVFSFGSRLLDLHDCLFN